MRVATDSLLTRIRSTTPPIASNHLLLRSSATLPLYFPLIQPYRALRVTKGLDSSLIPSEVRSLLGLESRSMASGHISRMHLNSVLTLFSDSGHIVWCNSIKRRGLPQDEYARLTNVWFSWTVFTGYINIRAAKNDHTFLA